ncbi:MAG: PLDc N-terminal domain-containing protein [Defluviitaleaceae bacterium]|nr:PLDc N-terminal domain-containing protein [Defluviitaleaceae bacterium]MCL2239773.1 PLDc N-terminal domain-containing protein [Defluviitaleaceae bacterium]
MDINIVFNTTDWREVVDFIIRLLPILIPLLVLHLILLVTAIVSLVRKPNPWGEKILWLLLVLLVDIIGPVIYFAVGTNHLDNKYAAQDGEQ